MKSIMTLIVFLFGITASGYSQSLEELAKRERERRSGVSTEAKVITNKDTYKYRNSPVTTGSVPAPSPAPKPEGQTPGVADLTIDGKTIEGKPKVDPTEATDFQGRPESFWRQTFTDARMKVRELESEEKVLTLKANDLQNQFYRESSGFRQQDIQREIQKTLHEQDQNKANLTKAKEELADLEKEARKSGALPGWIAAKP